MSNYIYALDTTNKRPLPVNADSNGNLQVDVVSMSGGGDATAANQVAAKTVLDNILTKNGEIETTADAILAKNTEIETSADAILAKNTEIKTSVDAVNTSLNDVASATKQQTLITANHTDLTAINTSLNDVASATKQQTLITANHTDLTAINTSLNDVATGTKQTTLITAVGDFETANHTDLSAISGTLSKMNPDYVQSALVNNAAIASGADTNEIDMGDHRHLTLFGTSSLNHGNWVLLRKSGTGGTKIPDGTKFISTSEAISGSGTYSFSITIENVGTRYLALRNTAGSSQTATIYQVLHR